jgi:hypothetical protein
MASSRPVVKIFHALFLINFELKMKRIDLKENSTVEMDIDVVKRTANLSSLQFSNLKKDAKMWL